MVACESQPENVVVSNGIAKIVDFGLCKRFLSARTLKIGTPDYMPPEVRDALMVFISMSFL